MKFICLFLALSLSISAFADRPVQSARMGKVGGLHPASWRVSEDVDQKGEGKEYAFNISIYKGDTLLDSFNFELNKGAKNAKKSQFSIKGDLDSEKFGTEISLEFIEILDNNIITKLDISAKYLNYISPLKKSYTAIFDEIFFKDKISLNLQEPNALYIKNKENFSIKIICKEI